MFLLKLLFFSLIFYELIADLDATTCPKGKKATPSGGCTDCGDGSFQPVQNNYQQCWPCRKCNEKSGSTVKQKCTKETNTICQCRPGFVTLEDDFATCQCGIGSELKLGECSKCKHGYFSSQPDSLCQKWSSCKSGVKFPGNSTSDNICCEAIGSNTHVPESPTLSKSVPFITPSCAPSCGSHPPHEGAQTYEMIHHTTKAAPGHAIIEKKDKHPSSTSNHTGMALLIFGIVGLVFLTAVVFKLHITPCLKRKPVVQTSDSQYRHPVEETAVTVSPLSN